MFVDLNSVRFSIIKPKIKNLGRYNTLADIKRDGLRVAYNRAHDSYWLIEQEFLRPVIKSPRECRSILVDPKDLKYKILMCHKSREELRDARALKYIAWGEERGFDKRPSCSGRKRWWDVGERQKARVNANYLVNDVMRFFANEDGFYVSDNFQEVHCDPNIFWQLAVSVNSTILQLFANIIGRANFGGGLMKIQTYEVADLLVFTPRLLDRNRCKQAMLRVRRAKLDDSDRRALDAIIFDALGLTKNEREAVYEEVVDLVSKRLNKARSV